MRNASLMVWVVLGLLIGSGTANALPDIHTQWQVWAQSEGFALDSDNNLSANGGNICQLCHQNAFGGSPWNAYGWAIRSNMGLGFPGAFAAVEAADSDEDPTGSNNMDEIAAGTQPGWRSLGTQIICAPTQVPNCQEVATSEASIAQVVRTLIEMGLADPGPGEPDIDIAPLTLDFGAVTAGMTETLSATINNLGAAELNIDQLNLTGSPDFSLGSGAPTPPFTIAPLGSAVVPVSYFASEPGDDTGMLDIVSNDPDEPTVSMALAGTGIPVPEICDIDVAPTALLFGAVSAGESSTLTLTVGNTGSGGCSVDELALTGSTDFALGTGAPVPPFNVPPGGTVEVPLTYTPSDPGDDSGTLSIASDDVDEPVINLSLAGSGEPVAGTPDIAVAPLTLDFGAVTMGLTQVLNTTISNTGETALQVSALNVTGSSDFASGPGAPTLPITLAPLESVDVPVSFTPSDVGDDSGMLEIISSDPDEPRVSVTLSGTGVAVPEVCDIDVDPLALEFGAIPLGDSGTLVVAIGNSGNSDCTVNGLTLTDSGDFGLGPAAPVPPFTVPPQGAVEVPVDYAPSSAGDDSGSLSIASDDTDEPVVKVNLTGSGEQVVEVANIQVAPLELDFGAVTFGMSVELTVTVGNVGNGALEVSMLNLSGSPAFALGAGAPMLPFNIDPMGAVDVPIIYTPSEEGSETGMLDILSNDPDESAVSVALTGAGIPPADTCHIEIGPMELAFGTVPLGDSSTLMVTIGNPGSGNCSVSDLMLTGDSDFALGAGAPMPPFSVDPGGTMAVPVTYTPSSVGDNSGSLSIASDDADGAVVDISLTGSGGSEAFVDLDIASFKVSRMIKLKKHREIRYKLTVKNTGEVNQPRRAIITATQDGIVLFSESLMVYDKPGDHKRTRFFGTLKPGVDLDSLKGGKLVWTATIDDDDPDLDQARVVSFVKGFRFHPGPDHQFKPWNRYGSPGLPERDWERDDDSRDDD